MDNTILYGAVLRIYEQYEVRRFPVDVFSLAIRMGYNIHSYSTTPQTVLQKVLLFSDSACLINRTIYFNDTQPLSRIRFSIAHELAHVILDSDDEDAADDLAAELLAPAPVIRTSGCRSTDDVAAMFGISATAADRAWFRGRRWTGSRLPQEAPEWRIVRIFMSDVPARTEAPEPLKIEEHTGKRLPPLLSREEKERLTPEQQKKIASIRRRRRKLAKQMPGAEEGTDDLNRFFSMDDALGFQKWGGGL